MRLFQQPAGLPEVQLGVSLKLDWPVQTEQGGSLLDLGDIRV